MSATGQTWRGSNPRQWLSCRHGLSKLLPKAGWTLCCSMNLRFHSGFFLHPRYKPGAQWPNLILQGPQEEEKTVPRQNRAVRNKNTIKVGQESHLLQILNLNKQAGHVLFFKGKVRVSREILLTEALAGLSESQSWRCCGSLCAPEDLGVDGGCK